MINGSKTHHQRHPRRPGHRLRQDGGREHDREQFERFQPVRRRGRRPRFSPCGRKLDRWACTRRTPPNCSSTTSGSARTNSPRRGGRRTALPDAEPAAGASRHRHRRTGIGGRPSSTGPWPMSRSVRRSAGRSAASRGWGSPSPNWPPASRCAAPTSTAASANTTTEHSPRSTPPRPTLGNGAAGQRDRCRCTVPRRLRIRWNTPVAKAFIDARVQRIYGGTNEIMKEIIHRDLMH